MRAALYARYSTDLQSADSIEDQFRVVERLATQHGFQIVERFSDAAISGGTSDRPGYQAMLAAARARQIDVVLAEDSSRLWRQLAEQWRAVAELTDLGVHLVCKDVDTRSENYKLLLSVHGAMADVYRDQIAYRTKRGLEGKARNHRPTGGRAYGYISACDSATGERAIHEEQSHTVREIFAWYAAGKSPRWIAAELNTRGVPSPGASWNRTSERLNAKRRRGWVPTAIHGDTKRGTGILNNPAYIGQVVWGRSVWKRSASNSKQRRWSLAGDESQVVRYADDRLRIVSDDIWKAVKARQEATAHATVTLRGALKRNGRLPRYILSGILYCEQCGGTIRNVNGREFGCASHKDGGPAACSNDVRVPITVAERCLLAEVAGEMLSDEGVALLERQIREHLRKQAAKPQAPTKKEPTAQIARKDAELEQLRALLKSGALSPGVAQAAISKCEEERAALLRAVPERLEKDTTRVIRMLPKAASVLRDRLKAGNAGLRDPRSVVQARNVVHSMFGGRVPVRVSAPKSGEKPYLIARLGLNRSVLLEAAMSCVKSGSGGRI